MKVLPTALGALLAFLLLGTWGNHTRAAGALFDQDYTHCPVHTRLAGVTGLQVVQTNRGNQLHVE